MAERISTGLRNYMLSKKASIVGSTFGTTISFGSGNGTAGRDTIVDSANNLAQFVKKGLITVVGSVSNDGEYEVLSVTAGTIEVATGSFSSESAGATIFLAQAAGGSFSDIFRNCVIDIYSGSQPATADSTESGTYLATVSLASGTFVSGEQTYGINFDIAASGALAKDADEVWSGRGAVDGTAGWFRMYINEKITGASTTALRLDGAISTSGAQLNMATTTITNGGSITIDSFAVTLPAS